MATIFGLLAFSCATGWAQIRELKFINGVQVRFDIHPNGLSSVAVRNRDNEAWRDAYVGALINVPSEQPTRGPIPEVKWNPNDAIMWFGIRVGTENVTAIIESGSGNCFVLPFRMPKAFSWNLRGYNGDRFLVYSFLQEDKRGSVLLLNLRDGRFITLADHFIDTIANDVTVNEHGDLFIANQPIRFSLPAFNLNFKAREFSLDVASPFKAGDPDVNVITHPLFAKVMDHFHGGLYFLKTKDNLFGIADRLRGLRMLEHYLESGGEDSKAAVMAIMNLVIAENQLETHLRGGPKTPENYLAALRSYLLAEESEHSYLVKRCADILRDEAKEK